MKKTNLFFTIILTLMMSQALLAQTNVKFEIKHLLGEKPCVFDSVAQNNFAQDFTVTRLQYYISNIAITHDTGKVTNVTDYWMLVDASEQTLVDLGSFDIQQVEAISFYVGVGQDKNHADPALYPTSHPLGPKAPAMHWGWSAGYRFIAMEGHSGANMSVYQLHGLGDVNYFKTEVISPMTTPFTNGVVISLDADYTRALENIDMSSGVFVHGDYGAAKQALLNFQGFVFSSGVTNTAIDDKLDAPVFQLFPNPTTIGQVSLRIQDELASYEVQVSDLLGRKVYQAKVAPSQTNVSLPIEDSGIYLVSLIKDDKSMATQKLVVK